MTKTVQDILAAACAACPLYILRRKFPGSGYARFMRAVERLCPFCRAYDRQRQGMVLANLDHCASRREALLKLGYDQERAIRFVVGCAGKLEEPVLDVGTGAGHCAAALAQQGYSLTSIDTDRAQLAKAGLLAEHYRVGNRIAFRKRAAHATGFGRETFSSIVSMNALHHFEKPFEVIDELWRLLSPGGTMIISDLDEFGFAAVDMMHAAEGKTHPRLGATFEEAMAYAGTLPGSDVSRVQGEHQDVLIVRKASA